MIQAARPQQMKPRLAVVANIDIARLEVLNERAVAFDPNERRRCLPVAHPARIVAFCILVLLPTLPAYATTVAILRTDVSITAAADSLVSIDAGVPIRGCKIISCGPVFAANAGLSRGPGFDVWDVLRRACGTGATPVAIADEFARTMERDFPALLSRFQGDPGFAKRVRDGGPIMSVALLGVSQSVPTVATREFFVSGAGIRVDSFNCPPECSKAPVNFFVLGRSTKIDSILKENRSLLLGPPRDVVVGLMEQEAAAEPSHIGGPIDVLTIDKNGARWLQRKPECAAEQ